MTSTFWQDYGLSMNVYKPTISGAPSPVTYTPAGTLVASITDNVDAYSHDIQAMGGYWTSTFMLNLAQTQVEDWIADGLGRHIEVFDHSLSLIWEGFVNRISASLGPLSLVRGPLIDVANYTNLVYSFVDTSTSPPTLGGRARAGTVEDNTSQNKWGVFQIVLSAGGMSDAEAGEVRDQYMAERKEPKTTTTLALGGRGGLSVQVECLGYVHLLKEYVYNYTTPGTTVNLSTKIERVIGADPNGIFDTSYDNITANTIAVPGWENDDKSGWDLIKSLVSQGDTSDNRYLFGIYKDRMPYYSQAPSAIEYTVQLADPEQKVLGEAGQRVLPWNLLPGRWLQMSDLLVGRTVPSELRLDPRAMFVESVSYTLPWGVVLTGGDSDKLSQKLAKMGLAGIGG